MFGLLIPTCSRSTEFRGTVCRRHARLWLALVGRRIGGIANEMLDRQLLSICCPRELGRGVGVYGAVYKISIFLILFNQAFRYAAEPFFFRNAKTAEGPEAHG